MTFLERICEPPCSIWRDASPAQIETLWWLVFVSMWDDIGRYSSAELSVSM